jgi:hypothetical protein
MKAALLLIWISPFLFQDIPLKSRDEFELKLDFKFKQRPQNEHAKQTGEHLLASSTPLPFLTAEILITKILEDEVRMKVIDHLNNVIAAKNLDKNPGLKFDLGFTDDLKDQVTPSKYFIHLYSRERRISRSVVILFDKDGTYYVNGEKLGKL